MNLKWSCVILCLIIRINGLPESEIESFVKLTELDYEDACKNVAEARWSFIKTSNNASRQAWENASEKYAEYLRTQKQEIISMTNETLENELLQYKLSLITRPGDVMLETENWKQFIAFVGETELSVMIGNHTDPDRSLRQRVDMRLAKSQTANEKLNLWKSWYENLKPLTNKFSESLKLAESAAVANGINSVEEYWTMLSDYENGYTEMKKMWNIIARLHKRIVKLVQKRLMEKYPDDYGNNNETIPAHLLGSLQGYDWTKLTLDILPHPNTTFQIRKNLLNNSLIGENLYKSASRLGNMLLKHVPEAEFWNQSDFNGQCPSHLINLCKGDIRLTTCSNEPSIRNYLSAHKDVANILIHEMSMGNNNSPILSMANRYSALESAIEELFGILSMSRAWLISLDLVKESDDPDAIRVVSLMITALDVLPRMAYYLAADTWRLDALKNKTLDPNELTATWWKYREQYEGISTIFTDIPTFLDDEYIISNKPYLSKFLGTLLGFQIYENIMDYTEMRYDRIEPLPLKHELIKMIQYGPGDNWTEIVKKYLTIYEVSENSLLKYFSPLDEYLDEIEDELTAPVSSSVFEDTLEKLEDEYKRKAEISSIVSTPMPIITNTTLVSMKEKIEQPKTEKTPNEQKNPPPQSPTIDEKSTQSVNKGQSSSVEKKMTKEDEDKVIKSGTSKAVWAVGAVLIATVTIVIIGIFGRQRCRKTPKNRRYV